MLSIEQATVPGPPDLFDGVAVRPAEVMPARDREALMVRPGFGKVHTDHMVTLEYRNGQWDVPTLQAYGPLSLDPATMALHYGQAIFEGLKAYRHPDGSVALFRPEQNALRFNRSAARLAMPELPPELFLRSLSALVAADRNWVPSGPGQSLYVRPLMFASEAMLGIRPADEYLFVVIASPVDPFFSAEPAPVRVWVTHEYVRAARGGTGEAKCAGNYAASLLAQAEATSHGCNQVVWLDAAERRWVEEMGGMNLFFVRRSGKGIEVTTPRLTGSLLAGITRESLLQLATDEGFDARESDLTVDEWRDGCLSGEVTEVFACGTAAVVAPVGEVRSSRGDWTVGDGRPGPVTLRLRDRLLRVQQGFDEDRHGWMRRVLEPSVTSPRASHPQDPGRPPGGRRGSAR